MTRFLLLCAIVLIVLPIHLYKCSENNMVNGGIQPEHSEFAAQATDELGLAHLLPQSKCQPFNKKPLPVDHSFVNKNLSINIRAVCRNSAPAFMVIGPLAVVPTARPSGIKQRPLLADVAHVVERMTCNHQAAGSTPAIGSTIDRIVLMVLPIILTRR